MADQLHAWAPPTAAALRDVANVVHATLVERARRWLEDARRGAPVDRGDLARSIDAQVTDDHRIAVSMPARYAVVEDGGTIRPRRGQWLAVPIVPAAALLPGPRSDIGGLFVVVRRDGRRFLASRAGGSIDLRWRLVRDITIRGRGFMREAFARAEGGFADAVLDSVSAGVA